MFSFLLIINPKLYSINPPSNLILDGRIRPISIPRYRCLLCCRTVVRICTSIEVRTANEEVRGISIALRSGEESPDAAICSRRCCWNSHFHVQITEHVHKCTIHFSTNTPFSGYSNFSRDTVHLSTHGFEPIGIIPIDEWIIE